MFPSVPKEALPPSPCFPHRWLPCSSPPLEGHADSECFVLTGSPDIFCHLCCIGMSSVQNHLRGFPSEELLHISAAFSLPALTLRNSFSFRGFAAIFGSGTGKHRTLFSAKKPADFIAFWWSLQKQQLYTFLYPLGVTISCIDFLCLRISDKYVVNISTCVSLSSFNVITCAFRLLVQCWNTVRRLYPGICISSSDHRLSADNHDVSYWTDCKGIPQNPPVLLPEACLDLLPWSQKIT